MGFGCCTNLQMCLLFTFNFIIWVCGAACLGVGIWALVDPNFINAVDSIVKTGDYGVSLATIQGAAGLLLGIGIITFIIAFCGCCGAIKRSKCLLRIYIGVMILLLILQITAVTLAFVFSGTINAISQDVFKYWVQNDVRANTTGVPVSQVYATEIVAQNQFNGECCGYSAGPADYKNSQYFNDTRGTCLVPLSCCVQAGDATWNSPNPKDLNRCCQGDPNATFTKACVIHLDSLLMFPYWLLYAVGIAFLLFQILVTIFACVVHKAIDEYD